MRLQVASIATEFPRPTDHRSYVVSGCVLAGWCEGCYRSGSVVYATIPGALPMFLCAECSRRKRERAA